MAILGLIAVVLLLAILPWLWDSFTFHKQFQKIGEENEEARRALGLPPGAAIEATRENIEKLKKSGLYSVARSLEEKRNSPDEY